MVNRLRHAGVVALAGCSLAALLAIPYGPVAEARGGDSGADARARDARDPQPSRVSARAGRRAAKASPAMTMLSPAAGAVWAIGTVQDIAWTHNLASQSTSRIDVSRDGGRTWTTLADGIPNGPRVGRYSWTVTGPPSAPALVRITSIGAPVSAIAAAIAISASTSVSGVTFSPSNAIFPNPDRGLYTWLGPGYANYLAARAAGYSLVRPYFMLDAYRNQALPPSFLASLSAEFQDARQTGVKVIPRFAYNFGPYPNPEPDASQARIEQHLQQLAPVLAANEDVISSVEAGFIGAWGEWHSSTNGLDTNPGAKAAILAALMAAVPPSRMIALRYPSDMQLLNGPPITAAEAYSGTNRARVGSHQDCFLASDDDWGTWGRSGNTIAYDKAYVAENGRWAVVGGETCNVNPPRSLCPTALAEMESLHFSNLDVDYHPDVVGGFREGGCIDEMRRRLGYRLELSSATYTNAAQRGTSLGFTILLKNVGFAAMFNARPVFAVLSRDGSSYVTALGVDPRSWTPGFGHVLSETITLPASMAPGTYTLSLWLPDKATSIQGDPRFAVRFANDGVWDGVRGYNVIATGIAILP